LNADGDVGQYRVFASNDQVRSTTFAVARSSGPAAAAGRAQRRVTNAAQAARSA